VTQQQTVVERTATPEETAESSRRAFLRKAAVVAWSTPMIVSLTADKAWALHTSGSCQPMGGACNIALTTPQGHCCTTSATAGYTTSALVCRARPAQPTQNCCVQSGTTATSACATGSVSGVVDTNCCNGRCTTVSSTNRCCSPSGVPANTNVCTTNADCCVSGATCHSSGRCCAVGLLATGSVCSGNSDCCSNSCSKTLPADANKTCQP
jgi:hypothetical protein